MMSDDVDHYAVLELAPGSPIAEVKSQYRRLAKKYHPDLHGNDAQSQAQFRRVHAAYAFLADAARKADYDAYLRALAALAASAPKPSSPPRASSAGPSVKPFLRPSASRPPAAHPPSPSGGSLWGALESVRMTRAAWLGATAAVILFLLGVGLSVGNETRGLSGGYGGPVAGVSSDGADDGSGAWAGLDPVPMPDPAPALDPAPFAASTEPLPRETPRPAKKSSPSLRARKDDKAAALQAETLVPDAARPLLRPGQDFSAPLRSERRSPRIRTAAVGRRSAARKHAQGRKEAPWGEGAEAATSDRASLPPPRLTPLPERAAVSSPPSLAPLRVEAGPASPSQPKAAPARSSQAAPFRTGPLKAAPPPGQGFIVWEK